MKLKQSMKKRLFLSAIVCVSFFLSFSQNADRIQRAYAFFTSSTPGMIRVDENGNPVKPVQIIERFMYIECNGTKMPVISNVFYDKTVYTALTAPVNEAVIHVGKKEGSGQEIMLTPKKGKHLWKVQLQVLNESGGLNHADAKHISIKARSGGKIYIFYLYNETQLMAPERY